MTILDRFLGHDAWTTRQLLLRCRELTEEQITLTFEIGNRSLRQTFEHIISVMESHTDMLYGRLSAIKQIDDDSLETLLTRLTIVTKEFSEIATRIDRENRADEMVTNLQTGNKRPLGGVITHVITHGMHHRAQILFMLPQLGVQNVIEGDALGWESQARGWGWKDGSSYGSMVPD